VTLRPKIVLDGWERSLEGAASTRPIALLALSLPSVSADSLAELSLGVRDVHLIRFRQILFGEAIECLVDCPDCRRPLEFAVRASDLLRQDEGQGSEEYDFESSGHQIRFRSPNTIDLVELSRFAADEEAFQVELLRRCVSDVRDPNGENGDFADLPRQVIELLAQEMERRDPMSVIRLDLTCPHCGRAWQSLFDIAAHLWSDVDRWAKEILWDVHRLASAYGWSESEILQMSEVRRARYLEMLGA
jgi:hypothetical protein